MHDIKAIRENPDAYVAGWSSRGVDNAAEVVARLLALDVELRAAQTAGQDGLSKRNAASKAIGAAMAKKDMAEADRLKAEVETLKGEIATAAEIEAKAGAALRKELLELKNLAAPDVPDGEDESQNVQVATWQSGREDAPRPVQLAFSKDHTDLGEALGQLDFEAAARMSGARFAVLKGKLARLERAIGQFMLDMQIDQHGYQEVNPPYLVREQAMYGTGQLPKFKEDLFFASSIIPWGEASRIEKEPTGVVLNSDARILWDEEADTITLAGDDTSPIDEMRYLIPTAEVSLTNLVREQVLAEIDVATPMRLTALTPCFRAEAGSAGRDTRGLIRQHQFSKVEMVSICRPEDSDAEHERMTGCAEAVLRALELPYRKVLLCKGDMGFSARKTYDLEVWLPSQNTYREISSCSNCGDFQARRMDARFKRSGEKKTEFLHTLNGSGLAVGRTLVAVMENYQQEDGSIAVPKALQPYMGGLEVVR